MLPKITTGEVSWGYVAEKLEVSKDELVKFYCSFNIPYADYDWNTEEKAINMIWYERDKL